MIKISSWNVNSINARIENLLHWLKEENPDIVLLQELKCTEDKFPREVIEDYGYNIAINGQKTYNGVSILSKYPLSEIKTNFTNNPLEEEARYIEAWVDFKTCSILVASVYVPNGQEVGSDKYKGKLEFLEQLTNYSNSLLLKSEKIFIGGDFNIALTEEDIYNAHDFNEQILFSLAERRALRKFIASGWNDTYKHFQQQDDNCYTWWDYRANSYNQNKGARIDYIFSSSEALQKVQTCFTAKKWRGVSKPSDHIPVSVILSL